MAQLGDYLIVHGFDAIAEAVDALTQRNVGKRDHHYHWIAAGAVDEEGAFYFNPANPTASSMYRHGESRFDTIGEQEVRKVQVRRLDMLLAEGVLPARTSSSSMWRALSTTYCAGGRPRAA
jgi:hypothetical protein